MRKRAAAAQLLVYVPPHADILLREQNDHGGCNDEVCSELARIAGIEYPLRQVSVIVFDVKRVSICAPLMIASIPR